MKKKNIIDKKLNENKKSHGRLPIAPPGFFLKDKVKYNRREKHKHKIEE